MNLSCKVFELIENEAGLAGSKTRMVFDANSSPFQATYSGPNVSNGHVIVSKQGKDLHMLYHAVTDRGDLVAGKAKVSFPEPQNGVNIMQLNWQWLTGDLSSGISVWQEVGA